MISWQYLAGMIDADGSIGTTRTGKRGNLVGRVIVANTDHDFLRRLHDEFGGSLSLRKTGSKIGWKPFGSLAWTNRKAEHILNNVRPFLLIKHRQADLVLELITMRNMPKSERCYYEPRPIGACAVIRPEIVAREKELALTVSALNKKGV